MRPAAKHKLSEVELCKAQVDFCEIILPNPWVPVVSFVLTVVMYTAIMLYVIHVLNNVMLRIRFDEDVISLI